MTAGDSYRWLARGQVLWLLSIAIGLGAHAQTIRACAVVTNSGQIQSALNLCSPGKAVVLKGGSFQSGPLVIPRGVTLYLDQGVILYASRNPRDYDLSPGSCGVAPTGKAPNCKPFIFSYQAAYSGLAGMGVIDGQGAGWKGATAPDLVSSYESTGFRIDGVTLRNAAGIHAAIYKTISFGLTNVVIESPANSAGGAGLLLSNAVDAKVAGATIRVPAEAMVLKGSILGPTSGGKIAGVHIFGGRGISIGDAGYGPVRGVGYEGFCLHEVTAPAELPATAVAKDCTAPTAKAAFTLDLSTLSAPGSQRALVVKPGESVQKAVDALPISGGNITVKPGTYREVVTIRKPHVHLHGEDPDPAKTVIVFNNVASNSGGTFNTSTVFVEADDVTIDHLSLVNDAGSGKGQGVALHVVADRAIFRNLRISGAQDTLFAASRYCYGDYGPCVTARQYFADCFIEGNTDFIFGDSKAVFERCELHGVATGQVMYTAQSKHTPDQDSGYIFADCHLTGEPRKGVISLGRSWRPYATVVFLRARIDAPVTADGWTEWLRFGVPTLPTAYYAEYQSSGPGANPQRREKYSHQLTDEDVKKWSTRGFLAGSDNWNPVANQ